MAKYMVKARYSQDGIKGVMAKGGTARVEAVNEMVDQMGGALEAFYFTFGDDDIVLIIDAPSHESMAAVAGAVRAAGVLDSYETVVLLTPEQVDDAAELVVNYTPPGG